MPQDSKRKLYVSFRFQILEASPNAYGTPVVSEGGVEKLAVQVGVDPYSLIGAEFDQLLVRTRTAIPVEPVAPPPPPPPTLGERLAQLKELGISARVQDGGIAVDSGWIE